MSIGLDGARLALLLAVLEGAGLPLAAREIFASCTGGLDVTEPAADLGIVAALVSSARGKALQPTPQPDDVYTVNELHVPTGRPISISLRTDDVQHAFFVPELRIKQDAVPNQVIPVWFDVLEPRSYEMVCAELCGWGHYKMKAKVFAESEENFEAWKDRIAVEQFDDGFKKAAE